MSENSTPTYAKTSKEHSSFKGPGQKSYQKGELSLWKLLFLGVFALALATVPLLGFFVATPLIIATLMYGRKLSYSMSIVLVGLFLFLSQSGWASKAVSDMMLAQFTLLVFGSVVAVLASEIILRKMDPAKGAIRVGILSAVIFLGGVAVYTAITGMDQVRERTISFVSEQVEIFKADERYQAVVKEGGEEAGKLEEVLSSPKELGEYFLSWVPGVLSMGVFIAVWIALFLVLKNSLVWKARFEYPYGLEELVKFRLPDQMVFVLIAGLGMTLAGSSLENFSLSTIGFNILYCLGILYFFQGFGIYLGFLDHLKIFGFLRPIMIIFTVFMAPRLVALVGVFDMWVNFRRFFNNKNENEGDMK